MIIVYITRLLTLFILLIGAFISYRTLKIANLRQRDKVSFYLIGLGFFFFTIGMTIEILLDIFWNLHDVTHILELSFMINGLISIILAIRNIKV